MQSTGPFIKNKQNKIQKKSQTPKMFMQNSN